MSSKRKPTSSNRIIPVGSRNFLGYHSSRQPEDKGKRQKKPTVPKSSEGNLAVLTKESRRCLRNLAAYRPSKESFPQPWLPFPRSRRAAVLVALFVGRKGDLYVLLSKRASTLRSFAGDTSLPGGKMDPEDETIEDTARREAFEEIGLVADPSKAPLLCFLEPFYVEKQLLVTPVVVLILDNTLQPILNSTEVTALFSHPLSSFLSSTPPASITRSEPELVELGGGEDSNYRYHASHDYDWDGPPARISSSVETGVVTAGRVGRRQIRARQRSERASSKLDRGTSMNDRTSQPMTQKRKVRMHRFLTGREAGGIKPVYGLTAAVLIRTARIGYSPSPLALASPDFAVNAPYEPTSSMRIAWAFCRPSMPNRANLLREALEEEGLLGRVDWARVRGVCGESGRADGNGVDGAERGRGRLGLYHRGLSVVRSKL
ncbi:NUDIX hydrolase domain-like protein [Rhodocollybia butyracea]|uniref:NUDIX hydrolase domain-like protein n=1 Tax=Rhodocollybia butyracea TaxID=206335 RepID=A0A9P5P855_9AGAR|nr:NUDIX hydrolase domain-like protein [Rhodocollybia butyracea]